MMIIDERGRVFGRVNLIDFAVGVFVLLLIPLAYGAYVLFRPQQMRITSVEPGIAVKGRDQRIRIRGEHFRPFLRAQIGTAQPKELLIDTPTSAEAVVPDLPEGTYDLTFYSESEEVARRPNAVTIVGPAASPPLTLQLSGAFIGLDDKRAAQLKPGQQFPDRTTATFEILALEPPRADTRRLRAGDVWVWTTVNGLVQVPAVLRAHCKLVESVPKCDILGNQVAAGTVIVVPAWGDFVIGEVRGDTTPVPLDVEVRFIGRPDLVARLHRGDVGVYQGTADRAAIVTAVGAQQPFAAQVSTRVGSQVSSEEIQAQERVASVIVTLRLRADQTPEGFEYRAQSIKVGAPITLETKQYVVRGTIVGLTKRAEPSAPTAVPNP